MDNYKRAYANNALYLVTYMICSGSIMQGFLLNSGVSNTDVYSFESIVSAISFVVLMLSVFFVDRIKKVITMSTVIPLLIIPVFIVMTFASLFDIGSKVFLPLLCCALFAYVFIGVNNTVSYKLPYEIIDMNNYGRFTGISGIISGVSTFLISIVYSYAVSKFEFFKAHGGFSVFAIICLIFSAYFVGSCKPIEKKEEEEKQAKNGTAVFKNPQMWFLLIPNFFRGVSAGIINLIAVVAVTAEIIPLEDISKTVIITQLALFASNLVFIKSLKKFNIQTVITVSGVIVCILLPMIVKTVGTISFLSLYFIVRLFVSLIDSSIPVCVTKFVPYSQIGAFTSIRMMAMTCGTSVAPLLLGFLEKKTSYFLIFIIATAMKLICSLAYACVTNLAQKAE